MKAATELKAVSPSGNKTEGPSGTSPVRARSN